MDIFDQISQEAKRAGDFLTEKANAVKDYTVATWTAADMRNRMDRLYKAIGQAVYRAHSTGEDTAEQINDWLEELSTLAEQLKEKETEKQAIRNKCVCSECGKPIGKEHAFCPYCGTKTE